MYKIGDHVIYVRDGVRGVVMGVHERKCHVIWEDHFCSWEAFELIQLDLSAREKDLR
ncbi:hypothetical protein [Caldalkalibacillus salinus]|uniref:hypothetical protein n=1 Tax=Caldalkalibacillus salinus TaxID=2803787 RepID=UPI001920C9AE|nr:hypothetical protein [Caldalkalibacillus salinus]